VSVQRDGNADAAFELLHQVESDLRLDDAGHVLNPMESQPIFSNSTPILTKLSTVWTGLMV
jgi:hypothetical protein